MDTDYISRASRALAGLTLVRQAAANEIAVPSRTENEMWIDEHRTHLLDGYKVDNRGYHDLLHPGGSGTAVVEIRKSR